jgi:hypothetical protein
VEILAGLDEAAVIQCHPNYKVFVAETDSRDIRSSRLPGQLFRYPGPAARRRVGFAGHVAAHSRGVADRLPALDLGYEDAAN